MGPAGPELTHQGRAFPFCLTPFLPVHLGMRYHLSMKVFAEPDPDFGCLQLPPPYLLSQALMLKCSLVPKVLGRETPSCKHRCSLPGSSGYEGSSRIQALLKMSGKVGTKSSHFQSRHILPTFQWLMLPYFAQR